MFACRHGPSPAFEPTATRRLNFALDIIVTNKPKDLNIPLYIRDNSSVWLFVGCAAVSGLVMKPDSLVSLIVTLGLVLPTVWFTFIGPAFLNNWVSNNRYIFAGWLVFALKLFVFYFVVKIIAPPAILFVARWGNI